MDHHTYNALVDLHAVLERGEPPPFEWVLAHASDGRLERVWYATDSVVALVGVYACTGDQAGVLRALLVCTWATDAYHTCYPRMSAAQRDVLRDLAAAAQGAGPLSLDASLADPEWYVPRREDLMYQDAWHGFDQLREWLLGRVGAEDVVRAFGNFGTLPCGVLARAVREYLPVPTLAQIVEGARG